MGKWLSSRGQVSDAMADILSDAIEKIGQLEDNFTITDLADAIEFASWGFLTVELNSRMDETLIKGRCSIPASELPVSEIDSVDFETIPNRGQVKWFNWFSQRHKEREEKRELAARANAD